MKPAAFRATFSDLKVIKTRKCVQIILEVPTEQFDEAYEVLGGLPNPASERWFAVAAIRTPEALSGAPAPAPDQAIQPRPDRAKRDWQDLPASQQAALRGNDATFQAFLREEHANDWREAAAWEGVIWNDESHAAECIRLICGVGSRSELDTNHKARVIWHQLDSQYQAWIAKERVGA